jgi:hypothetical protein
LAHQKFCPNCDIIEKAESLRLIDFRMVSGRSNGTECAVDPTFHHGFACAQYRTDRLSRNVVASRANLRIAAPDERKSLITHHLHKLDVRRIVDHCDLLGCGPTKVQSIQSSQKTTSMQLRLNHRQSPR